MGVCRAGCHTWVTTSYRSATGRTICRFTPATSGAPVDGEFGTPRRSPAGGRALRARRRRPASSTEERRPASGWVVARAGRRHIGVTGYHQVSFHRIDKWRSSCGSAGRGAGSRSPGGRAVRVRRRRRACSPKQRRPACRGASRGGGTGHNHVREDQHMSSHEAPSGVRTARRPPSTRPSTLQTCSNRRAHGGRRSEGELVGRRGQAAAVRPEDPPPLRPAPSAPDRSRTPWSALAVRGRLVPIATQMA